MQQLKRADSVEASEGAGRVRSTSSGAITTVFAAVGCRDGEANVVMGLFFFDSTVCFFPSSGAFCLAPACAASRRSAASVGARAAAAEGAGAGTGAFLAAAFFDWRG